MFSKTERNKGTAETAANRSVPSIISNNLSVVGTSRPKERSKVIGDILHESLSIEAGAYVEGQLKRLESAAANPKSTWCATSPTQSGSSTPLPVTPSPSEAPCSIECHRARNARPARRP